MQDVGLLKGLRKKCQLFFVIFYTYTFRNLEAIFLIFKCRFEFKSEFHILLFAFLCSLVLKYKGLVEDNENKLLVKSINYYTSAFL